MPLHGLTDPPVGGCGLALGCATLRRMEIPAKAFNQGIVATSLGTTPEYFDLTAWARGYIKVWCDEDVYVNVGAATGFAFTLTDTSNIAAANIPDQVASGAAGWQRVIPPGTPWLGVRTVSASGATLFIKPVSGQEYST